MKTDSLFYRLLKAQPTLAFELAGLEVPEPGRYDFISQEIKQTAFRLDGIANPPADRPDAPRGYVEVQFQPDEGFYLRFFSEILMHLGQYPSPHPWRAVVIYPAASVERPSEAAAPFLALPNLHRVYLDQLRLLDSANPKLWVIALIVAETESIAPIVGKVKSHQQAWPADGIDWLDLLETVLVYKLPQFTREEIKQMLGFNDVELKKTRFYQDVFGEGREEGQQEGLVKGVVKGEAALLLRLMERKFKPLPESARKRVAEADAETLLVWGERLLDANTLDEIWGALNPEVALRFS
jgi:predicted transposase/invertase (TIGR01784 family)